MSAEGGSASHGKLAKIRPKKAQKRQISSLLLVEVLFEYDLLGAPRTLRIFELPNLTIFVEYRTLTRKTGDNG